MKKIIYIMLPIIASGIFGCSKSDNVYLSANGRNSSEGLKQSEITITDDGHYILPDGTKSKIPMPAARKAEVCNKKTKVNDSGVTITDDGYYILPDGRKGKIPMPTVRKAEE